ncbi:MAG: glucose-1-phosphate adenylyltransferase [Veillonellaceae bacterium]|nr:glucose-1-phosphate adenylyltransferase [Veillonellaceae bacterium]
MPKKKCIAMILAGGQGTRLGALTKTIAKPAVPFGGKYRIIDFPLSNCSNSGIDTVGILTQYQPFFLHSYVGIGSPWDLDRKDGGVFVLPPYTHDTGGEWYKGTADAIFQNVAFIDQYDPVWVVILSGDHIYKMDYNRMLEYHEAREADATLAVIEVPWEDTRRFGIMNTDVDDRIVEFEEKPVKAKNNLASMGVYVFRWQYLRYYLEKDSRNSASDHDFGRNIIPLMLEKGQSVYAYRFKGYWRDVGTVESLWAANMDLLADRPQLDLHDSSWRIYSVNPVRPPHFAGRQSHVSESIVSEGCQIFGEVKRCVLFPNVVVERGAQVMDSVLMPGVTVAPNAVIRRAVVGPDAIVAENSQIGGDGPVTLFMEKTRIARKGARA